MSIANSVLDKLREIAGPDGYLDDDQLVAPFTVDHRQLYHGRTPIVLRPASTEQVSALMKVCYDHHVGVVPVGGNTGYMGGATPSADNSQVVLSLARMRRIREVNPYNYTLTAEAGCVLSEVQAAAASIDRLFPLSLGSEGSCQLGGNLSTNAGGTAVLRYGMARDLILGLEVVLPDGRVLSELKGLRKNNTGYDLRHLFIGAEGTLGVITAAVCKLFPAPKSIVTAFVAVPSPAAAVELLAHMRAETGDAVSTFELVPRFGLELVVRHIANTSDPLGSASDWYVLLEATSARADPQWSSSIEGALQSAIEQGLVTDAAIAQSGAQRDAFWRLRETIPEAQRREGGSIKHDISVTTTQLPDFIVAGTKTILDVDPTLRVLPYGHLGDGNLHFNVSEAPGGTPRFDSITHVIERRIHDLVAQFGGSFSAEHGIGQLKREELIRYKHPVSVDVMRAIKHALDPKGIMNPGKVVS